MHNVIHLVTEAEVAQAVGQWLDYQADMARCRAQLLELAAQEQELEAKHEAIRLALAHDVDLNVDMVAGFVAQRLGTLLTAKLVEMVEKVLGGRHEAY